MMFSVQWFALGPGPAAAAVLLRFVRLLVLKGGLSTEIVDVNKPEGPPIPRLNSPKPLRPHMSHSQTMKLDRP